MTEEESGFIKRRRTSSYHDPLALASPRYHSLDSIQELSRPTDLSVRDKADILTSLTVRRESGKLVAIEGPDAEVVEKVRACMEVKLETLSVESLGVKGILGMEAPFTSVRARWMYWLACVHEKFGAWQGKTVVVGGYLLSLADRLAESFEKQEQQEQQEDKKKEEQFSNRQRWSTASTFLRGLPAPDYVVYIQPSSSGEEVSMAELNGGTKMLIVGGEVDEIVDIVVKNVF